MTYRSQFFSHACQKNLCQHARRSPRLSQASAAKPDEPPSEMAKELPAPEERVSANGVIV